MGQTYNILLTLGHCHSSLSSCFLSFIVWNNRHNDDFLKEADMICARDAPGRTVGNSRKSPAKRMTYSPNGISFSIISCNPVMDPVTQASKMEQAG